MDEIQKIKEEINSIYNIITYDIPEDLKTATENFNENPNDKNIFELLKIIKDNINNKINNYNKLKRDYKSLENYLKKVEYDSRYYLGNFLHNKIYLINIIKIIK